MTDVVLHARTAAELVRTAENPGHALLITGLAGMGKGSVATTLASTILRIEPTKWAEYPYGKHIRPGKEPSISVDVVRELEQFLSLRVPGNKRRIVIVEDAHKLTHEAQNALLKTLEEPPANTTLILTSISEHALLPTIRSRATLLSVKRPATSSITEHFESLGHTASDIQRANLMSGGLPGLMHSILTDDAEHPLVVAAQTAREIVQKTTFERLALIDSLAKDRQLALNVLTILQQMAHVTLSGPRPTKTWQNILARSYEAAEQLSASAQPKLVLTNLMLSL